MDRAHSHAATPSRATDALPTEARWDLIPFRADPRFPPVGSEPDRDRRRSWMTDYDEVE